MSFTRIDMRSGDLVFMTLSLIGMWFLRSRVVRPFVLSGFALVHRVRGAPYSGFFGGSLPPVSVACRIAAAPSIPPMPIDSTALLGISISAPFSFSPS